VFSNLGEQENQTLHPMRIGHLKDGIEIPLEVILQVWERVSSIPKDAGPQIE
jgi:hypothetical protein